MANRQPPTWTPLCFARHMMPRVKDLSVNQDFPAGVRIPAVAVSSFAPNKANFRCFWLRNKDGAKKQSQYEPNFRSEPGPIAALATPALPRGNRGPRRVRLRDFAMGPSRCWITWTAWIMIHRFGSAARAGVMREKQGT